MITREAMTGGRTRLAILTICCGVAFLASNDAIAKLMVARYDPIQVVFFRNLIALPMVGAVVLFVLGKKGLRTRHLRVHAIRGLLMLAGAYSFFKGLESLALAEATAKIVRTTVIIAARDPPIVEILMALGIVGNKS